ncbi:MAG: NADH-quinone oxidoreductase subunit H, partial [Victivallales bacterium]|nr:NADH-quinone oxidoreductase subunit H [Victivallales bacterium]
FFAGRHGQPVLQLYYDLNKLRRKESIASRSSGGFLAIAPLLGCLFTVTALLLLPLGYASSPLAFTGDVIFFFYLLGTARLITVLAAMETGSSFEGMGAAREMHFSALAEGAIFAVIAFIAAVTGKGSCDMLVDTNLSFPAGHPVSLVTAAFAAFIIMLVENCRVPFDDPETHLELTMIHEAMILDYAGPDLAAILYTASLKLWLFASFFVMLVMPDFSGHPVLSLLLYIGGVLVTGIAVGCVESCMARFRLLKIPQLLLGALAASLVGIIYLFVFEGGVQ